LLTSLHALLSAAAAAACRFLFKEQYIELSTAVPEDADLYGLGEVTLPTGLRLPRDDRIITLFNSDMSPLVPYVNLYSSHPFILQVNKGVCMAAGHGGSVVSSEATSTCMCLDGCWASRFGLG
jgi:alpha-glucosidase (family GH31 glycosyl hydrolase)